MLAESSTQATGGITTEELARIRHRVLVGGAGPDVQCVKKVRMISHWPVFLI